MKATFTIRALEVDGDAYWVEKDGEAIGIAVMLPETGEWVGAALGSVWQAADEGALVRTFEGWA